MVIKTKRSQPSTGGLMATVGVSGVGLVGFASLSTASMALFGVPLAVVGMGVAGSFISTAYWKPEKSRSKMFFKAIANAFLSIVSVAILPPLIGWDWVSPKLEPPLAGGMAIALTYILPNAPEIIRKIFKLDKYNPEYSATREDYQTRGYRNSSEEVDYESYYDESEEPVQAKQEKPRVRAKPGKKRVI